MPALGHMHQPGAGDFVRAERADVAAFKDDLARLGAHQARDCLERRGLAGAVGAQQRHDLAAPHFEVNAAQRVDLAIGAFDTFKPEKNFGVRCQVRPPRLRRRDRPRSPWDSLWISLAVPSAIMTPWSRTLTRSEMLHDQPGIVLDQQNRDAALVANARDQADQFFLFAAGQTRCGLVEQQQLGAGRERAGDLDAPLLAVRQRRRLALPAVCEADKAQAVLGNACRISASSRRCDGGRKIAAMTPALVRQCMPDMTFSRTLISRNSRTFWKVRAMPALRDMMRLQLAASRCRRT